MPDTRAPDAIVSAQDEGIAPADASASFGDGEKTVAESAPPVSWPGAVTPSESAALLATAQASALDEERLRQIRAETERVSAVLASVFLEEEPPLQAAVPTAAEGDLPGLDALHGKLVRVLAKASTWSRADFEREAGACDLLPDGALEVINEWAYDHFNDALIVNGDPLTVRFELLPPEEIADAA